MIVFTVRRDDGKYLSTLSPNHHWVRPRDRLSVFLKRSQAEVYTKRWDWDADGNRYEKTIAKVIAYDLSELCMEHDDCRAHPELGKRCVQETTLS